MDTEYIFMAGAFGHGAGCYWFISHWGLWWQLLFLLCRHLGMVILEQFFLALGHGASGHSNLELGVLGRCFSCNLFAWSWADQSWAGAHGHCIGSNFADIYAGDSVKSAITEWQCLGYMHLVQWLFWCHTLGSNKGNRLLLWVYFGHYTASMNIFMAATQPIWGFAKGGLRWEVVCLHLWYSLCVRLWSGCRPQGGGTRSDWEVLCLDLPGCTQGLSSLRQQPCHWFGVSFWAGSAVPILLIAGVQTLMCLVCKVQETCCMYGSYYGRFWYSWRFWQPSSSSKCGTGNPRTVGRASKTHITLWVPANQTFRFPSPKYKSPEWLQCFLGPTSWRWNAQVMGQGDYICPMWWLGY